MADVVIEIQTYQHSPYPLTPEQSIQEWIHSQDPVGDMSPNQWQDHLFDMSRAIEPKDQPPKKVVSSRILLSSRVGAFKACV